MIALLPGADPSPAAALTGSADPLAYCSRVVHILAALLVFTTAPACNPGYGSQQAEIQRLTAENERLTSEISLLRSQAATVAAPAARRGRHGSRALALAGGGIGPASARRGHSRPPRHHAAPARVDGGGCSCAGGNVCIGPRGGRYCITSGGSKRYGV